MFFGHRFVFHIMIESDAEDGTGGHRISSQMDGCLRLGAQMRAGQLSVREKGLKSSSMEMRCVLCYALNWTLHKRLINRG
jgi:hypothetical protein